MKKLLIGLLIALALMCLLFVACNACDKVPTAQAIDMYSASGVVNPNSFSEYDFSNVQYYEYVDFSYLLNLDDGIYTNDINFSVNGGEVSIDTRSYLSIVYTIPASGYYVMNVSVRPSADDYSYNIEQYDSLRLTAYNCYRENIYSGRDNLINSYSQFNSNSYSFSSSCKAVLRIKTNTYSIKFIYCKLEALYSFPQSSRYTFTGFVIPNYTAQPDPVEPSPYDSWDGMVHPNLLTHTDFYVYPYHSSGSMDRPDNIYYSEVPSDVFSAYPDHVSYIPTYPCSILYSNNVGSGLATTVTLEYNYPYRDLFYPVTLVEGQRYSLTYTLDATMVWAESQHYTITLEDDLGHSVSTTVTDNSLPYVSLFLDIASYQWNSVHITITFVSAVDEPCDAWLYYSKLEVGNLFTGFVPEDHSDGTVVQGNILPNYDFRQVPEIKATTYEVEPNADNWVCLASNVNDVAFGLSSSYLSLTTSNGANCSLVYEYVPQTPIQSNYFNFALRAWTMSSIEIKVYPVSNSSVAPYASFGFAKSFDEYDLSVSFPAYQVGCRIVLTFSSTPLYNNSTSRLYYAKLEYGDAFTGYVGSYDIMSENSYDAGYNAGVIAAGALYTSKNYNLEASVDNLQINQGWEDFGISSPDEFTSVTLSIFPAYYSSNGFPVVRSGFYYDTASAGSESFTVYASRDAFEGNDLSIVPNIYILTIYKNVSYLALRDTRFTNDYLTYPTNRSVVLTVSKGFAELVNFYNDAVYNEGFDKGVAAGKIEGFNNGKAVGYQDGLTIANNGTWRGLVSALVDVPVTAIVSFLDFEVLGINMFSLFKTIVTITLFFFIVKLCVGKLG